MLFSIATRFTRQLSIEFLWLAKMGQQSTAWPFAMKTHHPGTQDTQLLRWSKLSLVFRFAICFVGMTGVYLLSGRFSTLHQVLLTCCCLSTMLVCLLMFLLFDNNGYIVPTLWIKKTVHV